MKPLQAILWIVIILVTFGCNGDNPLISDKITYEEALELQNIEFVIDGRLVKGEPYVYLSNFNSFSCVHLTNGCGENEDLYYQAVSIEDGEGTDESIFFMLKPSLILDSNLVDYPEIVPYIYTPYQISPRPFLRKGKYIKQYYLDEGDWTGEEKRIVRMSLRIGELQNLDFYADKTLDNQDQFEITEIIQIRDQRHTFLVSGNFQATLPDDRHWLEPSELKDPVQITEGKFSFIIEPINKS